MEEEGIVSGWRKGGGERRNMVRDEQGPIQMPRFLFQWNTDLDEREGRIGERGREGWREGTTLRVAGSNMESHGTP